MYLEQPGLNTGIGRVLYLSLEAKIR